MKEIKRLIFELDNTLIPCNDKYVAGFARAVKEHNVPFDIAKKSEMYQK